MSTFPPKLNTIEQARPLKPDSHAEDFEADKLAVLDALRRAGPHGMSTMEFLRRGIGGVRPPNRVCDLRKDGHLIQTVRESGRQCRFVLLHENPRPIPRPGPRKPIEQIPISDFMRRRREEDERATPLFAGQFPSMGQAEGK